MVFQLFYAVWVWIWGLFKLQPTPVDDHPKSKSSSLHSPYRYTKLLFECYDYCYWLWLCHPIHSPASTLHQSEHKYLIEITIHFPPRVRNTYNIIFFTISVLFTLTLNLQFYMLYVCTYLLTLSKNDIYL